MRVRVVESWTDPHTWRKHSRVKYIFMIDKDKIIGQISVIEGLIVQVKDVKLQAKLKAQIIILKQMLGD